MDDIDLLRQVREDVPPAERAVMGRARTRLLDETHGRTRVPAFRLGWRLAVVGGLAAALAGAVGVAQLQQTTPASGPRQSTQAAPDATAVLTNAALAADKQQILPARPDQYVYVESVVKYPSTTPTAGEPATTTSTAAPQVRRVWKSVDGTRDGLLRERPKAADQWRESPLQVCPPEAPKPCPLSPAYRIDLPTNADEMLTYLQTMKLGKGAGRDNGPKEFLDAASLVREAYLPPTSLSALFTALTKVPGITVTTDASDLAGRPGIAVGLSSNGGRQELIFDRASYTYLGDRFIDSDGSVASGSAQLAIAIVNKPGQV